MTRPGAVYRHLDASGRVLYIGSSYEPARRFLTHVSEAKSEWVRAVVSISVEWFDSIEDARAAEKVAIADECPPHNYRDNPQQPNVRRRPISGPILADWLRTHDVDLDAFSAASGISVKRLRQFIANETSPSGKARLAIEEATGGDIPPIAWCRGGQLPPYCHPDDRARAEALLAPLLMESAQ